MNATIEDLPGFALMGITCRNSPDKIDYGSKWRRFDDLQHTVEPLSTGDHSMAPTLAWSQRAT